ncbi:DUF1453 domain-containing protein [Streptomyces varsoviensis]|uniref:DUF1453 domain-containing protein n=1 Tax=Streptomyces varsoviensis TaxID=67373 RepID=UPI0033F73322
MNGWLVAGLVVAGLIAVVVKRLLGEPLAVSDLLAPAAIFSGIGIWILCDTDDLAAGDIGWIVGGAALGTALGAVRGTTVRVFAKEGVLWQRYTGRTFLVIVGSLLVMAVFGLLAQKAGMHADARPVQLSIGVGFLGEALVVGRRARTTGIPFAPERSRLR